MRERHGSTMRPARFRKKIVHVVIEHESPDRTNGNLLPGNNFGGVEYVEIEVISEFLIKDLNAQVPFWEIAALDELLQISAMKVRIGTVELNGLVPDDGLQPLGAASSETFTNFDFAVAVDQSERMRAEAFHCAERPE
jgi:hypothetical protein